MAESRYVENLIDQGDNFDRWYVEVVQKAGLADDAPVRGCKVIRPYGYGLWELMVARIGPTIIRAPQAAQNSPALGRILVLAVTLTLPHFR